MLESEEPSISKRHDRTKQQHKTTKLVLLLLLLVFVLSLKEVPLWSPWLLSLPWSSTTAPTASFSLLRPTLFRILRFLFATDQVIWDLGEGREVVLSSDWFGFKVSCAVRCVFSLPNSNHVKLLQRL